LPIIVTGSASLNNALLFLAMLVIFSVLGHFPGSALIWLPALMLVNVSLALGFGLALGVLNVFMRDVGQIVPVVLQFVFWFTPIVYMVDIIPNQYRGWLILNPLVPIITGYQNALLYNSAPDWAGLGMVALLAANLLAFALVLFRRASPEMVDQL
jgi:lipopolysaccharide transport system permease protein